VASALPVASSAPIASRREQESASREEGMLRAEFSRYIGLEPTLPPPQTKRFCPVTQLARSETKESTAFAISSGVPILPSGIAETMRSESALPTG
jgi:hypothetical protein